MEPSSPKHSKLSAEEAIDILPDFGSSESGLSTGLFSGSNRSPVSKRENNSVKCSECSFDDDSDDDFITAEEPMSEELSELLMNARKLMKEKDNETLCSLSLLGSLSMREMVAKLVQLEQWEGDLHAREKTLLEKGLAMNMIPPSPSAPSPLLTTNNL